MSFNGILSYDIASWILDAKSCEKIWHLIKCWQRRNHFNFRREEYRMRLRNMEHPHYMRTPYTPIYRGAASKARYHEFSLFFCMTYKRDMKFICDLNCKYACREPIINGRLPYDVLEKS